MIKIGAVEYINTLPFLQAIQSQFKPDELDVVSANPAICANLFYDGLVDIALVPVGALDKLPPHKIITDFCIGSEGPVDTVAVLSDEPLADLKYIVLDQHSRTSARLIQILCREFWNKTDVKFVDQKPDESLPIGYLFIGDKVREKERLFKYKYDLGEAWTKYTNLPMVFAVWIAKPTVDSDFIQKLNVAFKEAIAQLDEVNLDVYDDKAYWLNYLKHSIRFHLDEKAKQGLDRFIKLSKVFII